MEITSLERPVSELDGPHEGRNLGQFLQNVGRSLLIDGFGGCVGAVIGSSRVRDRPIGP
jgi:hypothetical protein